MTRLWNESPFLFLAWLALAGTLVLFFIGAFMGIVEHATRASNRTVREALRKDEEDEDDE